MKIAYYIVTGLMAAFMGGSAIPDIIQIKEAQEIMQLLGYPPYLLPFLGVAKILGVIGVLQPWYPRLREWAYAGLVIDVVGAFYSHVSIGDVPSRTVGPIIALVLIFASYILYRRVFTAT
jgi:hypothetical protein